MKTRQNWLERFATTAEAMAAENDILGAVGASFPAPAVVTEVIEGKDLPDDHPEYWGWLIEQYEGIER